MQINWRLYVCRAMATTKIWAVHSRLDHLVNYVANPEKTANAVFDDLNNVLEYAADEYKTEQKYFVSGLNCQPETAYPAMRDALKLNTKPIKILGFHGYQSFVKDEVTAVTAHEIGMKLAQELWGNKFQVVVSTHCNTDHYHNHFIVCGTSFMDGTRYPASKATYRLMREVSDRLCREYALNVIDNKKPGRTKHYTEWQAEKLDKPTWHSLIKDDIDLAISESVTDKQFFYHLRQQGYHIKFGKDITVRPPGKERGIKLARNFGDDYTLDNICKRILVSGSRPKPEPEPERKLTAYRISGNIKRAPRVGGFRGLYLHYCYLLGFFPKKTVSPARINFLFREDLRKMNTISEEAKLLARHRIDTVEQLSSYKGSVTAEINALTIARKALRSKSRGIIDETALSAIKAEISILSQKLGVLRKEAKLCDGIAERSVEMSKKMKIVRQQESAEKEGKQYDQFRGSR